MEKLKQKVHNKQEVIMEEIPQKDKRNILKRIIDAPGELFVFLLFTPFWTKTPLYISIPLGFIQMFLALYFTLIFSNSETVTVGMRVPFSAGGIIGALLSVAIFPFILGVIADYYIFFIFILVLFYAYVTTQGLWKRHIE